MSKMQTREVIRAHASRYPQSELQDYMKFLFQSAFGCEHLIADPSAAAAYIRREAENAAPCAGEIIEPLDGAYCRVHLDILKEGLSPEAFAEFFARSAQRHDDGVSQLEEKLFVLMEMIRAGELPYDPDEAMREIDRWREAGFPACHHSQRFRDCYAPAYRLLKKEYADELAKKYFGLTCETKESNRG